MTAPPLAGRFDGVLDPATVRRCLDDSYVDLHRTAHADPRLPQLAERFAADRLTALAQLTGRLPKDVPQVLFVCVHNAGRSQLAAALMTHHAAGAVRAQSAGSRPDPAPSAAAAAVLAEVGVGLDDAYPKPVTGDILRAADVVVIAGGGDAVPRLPGPRYEVWDLPHPPGSDLDGVRAVRDDIDRRVRALLTELTTHH
ncbi:arsenate-mycothiol transferase ArsC [Spirilliplanes yamanashiensis]|uniref:Low molecular weight phosphatase family protein n=1 Tax=Spirilliplanes yamanashiensis TaxID=42233 RepID=A0A8J3Y771_9ACTN|nr:low molecular weight phosphatase family protein [Spirilliplanes yamanashiensis]MDP9815140.1 protein-tyrosine-phosphatase [Spirilliplanes yamanashiensis]GIJ02795.1 low molecular weight phosphatase family protein [Spirilliplanes yamanashiensis]